MIAALELQAAVVAHLLADADLAALVGDRIHDSAPRAAAFPSVTFGETGQADWSSDNEAGGEVRLSLHVWSRGVGKREAWTVIGHLMRLLHDAPLSLEAHALVLLRVTFAEVRLDPDGLTEHGVVRVAALVED
ncbi:hypothetical protein K32_14430 [Kaistia sp. 32K]|uniref:DUF3168 domain-containing protein n=1 Tax=Kaistia sp. 32K TaxID=2795690 RepID=UPI001915F8F7|nr:DUF3168 domain-containing protein [Kaistia sp. 32K]BCP52826.1 hypothetical protein K32_14430 [Kaistia sp. 32K]